MPASDILTRPYLESLNSKWHNDDYVHKAGEEGMAFQTMDIKVASNGRMVLPLIVRKAMGLHGDGKVILTVEGDQVRLSPIGHGVSRAQALYREHAKQARTTDDFLNERRAEAAADAGDVAVTYEEGSAA